MLELVRIGVHVRGGVSEPVALILTSITDEFEANLLAYGVVDGKREACYHFVFVRAVKRLPLPEASKRRSSHPAHALEGRSAQRPRL